MAGALKILIVEDEPQLAEILKDQLEELFSADVSAFPAANEAYNHLISRRTKKDRFHLIISDLRMPRMSGLELLRKVRQNDFFKDIPFVVLTGHGDETHLRDSIALQVTDFILKPYTLETLKSKLGAVVQKIKAAQEAE